MRNSFIIIIVFVFEHEKQMMEMIVKGRPAVSVLNAILWGENINTTIVNVHKSFVKCV